MKRQAEKTFDLTIDPETVRLFIAKAQALEAGVSDDYEAGHEHEIEFDEGSLGNNHHEALVEEEEEDLTEEELRELIDDLNVDETAELIAIAWIGRGDYGPDQWKEAVEEAAGRQTRKSKASAYLIGMPLLSEYLKSGLEAIGA